MTKGRKWLDCPSCLPFWFEFGSDHFDGDRKKLGGGGSFWVAKLFPQSLNMYGHPMNK